MLFKDKLEYRSMNNKFAVCFRSINLTQISSLYFSKLVPDYRSSHLFNGSHKTIVISNLKVLNHDCIHGCIIDSNLSIKTEFIPSRYPLEKKYLVKTLTHAHIVL